MNKPTRHFLSDSQLVQVRPMALEQRFMFDAAAVSTVTDLPHTTEATHTDAPASDGGVDGLARFAEAAAVGIQEVDSAADPSVSGVRLEVVFVDGSIRNYQQLVADVKPGTEVVVLGGTKDGLQQIADYLDGRSGIDAIHLLSHGSEGTFELGNTWLNSQNIGQHAEQLNAIGAALASDGDILIYGCNTGEGTQGETLLSELARLTQADIAASENSTGAANKGGDWLLERQLGEIATASLSVEGYQSLLAAPVDQNFDDPVLWRPLNNNSETIGGVTYTMVTPTLGSNAVAAIFSDDNWFSITPTGADQAVVFNYDGNTTIAGPIDVRIASADGAEFRLVSMEIDTGAGLGTNPNLTVKGYLNGVVVASDTINTGVSESTGSVTYTKNGIAVGFGGTLTFNSAWQYINEIRITGTDTVIAIDDLNFEAAVPPNVAPVVSNLNGDSVTWAGVGNTVSLDAGGNANLADTELNALNSGNGNWAGASLIIQRPGTAVSGDTFGFNTSGALFTVSGGNLQSGGQTFATVANTGGVLTISFTSSATAATTALVNDIAQRITYRSDTPAGDATLRFTLSDGMASSTADVTVTSNTIHVTATGDAQSDGIANGVTLREAITIANAQAGADTIILPASLAGQTVTLGSALTISEAVTIDADAAPGVIIAGTGITANATLTIINGSGDSASISAPISGTGAVVKGGAGTLILSGTNSYSGTTTISAGTLSVTSDSNLGAGAVSLAASTTLTVTGATTINNAITLSGAATVNNFAAVTLSGNITGDFGLTKTGVGFLTLSGTSQGFTTLAVDSGRLSVAADANLGSGALTLADGTRLNITGATTIDNAMTLTGVATVFTDPGIAAVTLSGVISGSGGLTKGGRATLTLSASNTYTGATLVSSGTLVVAHNNALGDTAGATTVNGDSSNNASLRLSDGVTTAENFVIAGTGGPGNNGALRVISGSATITGTVTLTAASFIRLDTGASLTVSGVVSGAYNLRALGRGTTTLSGDNTYSGGTTIQTGTLSVVSGSNLGTGTVTLLDGSTLMVTGTTTIANAIALNSTGINTTHTVNNANAVTLSGNITGTLPLTKAGGGVLTLSGTNSYSGTTTVSAGTLVVTGSLTGAGAVSVASGATLSGTGSVAGAVSVASGGTAAPGVGPGLLTLNNGLTLASGSTLVAEVNGTTVGTGYDRIVVTGAVNVTGATLTPNVGFAPTINDSFILVDNDGVDAVIGTFTNMAEGAVMVLGGNSYQISYVGGDGNDIVLTALSIINTAPVLAGADGSTAASEQMAVSLVPGLTVADADNATLASATVSLSSGFQSGEDVLAFTNDNATLYGNITANYNAATGVLTLTSAAGTASVAQWQAALRSVTYSNASDAPSPAQRTISFSVNDGNADSNAASKLLNVTAVNDAPQITAPATLSVTEDQANVLTGISFSDPDAAAGFITASFSVPSGMLTATSGGGVTVLGSGSGSLTLTGTLANVNAFIGYNNLIFTPAANATANVTLSVGINDHGNTGSGGAQTDSQTVTLQVTAVNDAPLITAPLSIAVSEDVSGALTGISFADPDAGSNTVTATFSVPSGTLSATSSGSVTVGGTSSALTLSGSLADLNAFIAAGQLSFQTAANATANVALSISINDGALTDSRNVTLNVTAVNDAPLNSLPAAQSVDQNAFLVFSSGNGNLISISDVDAGAGNLQVTLTASNGLLTLSGTTGLSFASGDGTADASMTFSGTQAAINAALNGMALSPTVGYHGAAALQIISNDLGLSGTGGAQTDIDTIAITVKQSPHVTSINRTGATALTNGSSVAYTVTFNEAVTGVGASDFTLATTGSASGSITSVTGSGATYTVTVQSLSGDGTLRLDLNSTGTGIQNAGTQPVSSGYTSGQSYTLDTTAPTAPAGLDMTAASDSGLSSTDNITNIAMPTITGTAEPGGTVTLYDTDGTTVLGAATVDGSGNWSITSSALGAGGHTLTAKVTDAAGNISVASSALTLTIDTTAPAIPAAPTLHAASDSGNSSSDNLTRVTTPTFTGTAESGSLVTLYDTDGTTVLGTATATGGVWSITSSTLAEGSHSVTAKATDAAGNISVASSALTLTIDTTAPAIPAAPTLHAASDSGNSSSDNLTRVTTPTFTGTAESGSLVTLYDTDGTTVLGTATAIGGVWSITSSTLAEGSHSLMVKATDAAGNVSVASSVLTLTIDTTAPATPAAPTLNPASDSGSSGADNLTNVTTPTFTGTAESGSLVTLYDTDGTTVLGTATAAGSGNWSITSSALGAGAHTLTARVTDAAGNTSAASAGLVVTIDVTAPTAIALSASSVMDVATGLDTTVASLSSLDSQAVNYALVAGNGTNDADNARFVLAGGMLQSRAQLAAGAYNIRVSATDAAGNVSYQDFVVTVNSPPVPVLSSAAPLGLAGGAALSPSAQTPTATDGGEAQAPGLSFLSSGTVQAIPGFAADMAALNGASLWVPESVLTTSSPAAVRLGMNGSSGSTGAGLRALVPTHEVVIERGEQLTFTLPEGSFGHSDAAALVTLSARLADGRPLPGYLHFDPATGTFTFDEEVDERVKQLKVVITAVDDKGQTAGITVVIKLKDKARNTDAIELPLKAGKLALSEQLRLADRPAGTLADLAALSKAFAASHAEHGRA